MIRAQTWGKSQRIWEQLFLLGLAVLCVSSVLESMPDHTDGFYGHDFYTISGLKSTTEVFRHGGTYILHNYSAQAPGCDGCESIQIQADFGAPNAPQGVDVFSRIAPQQTNFREPNLHHGKRVNALVRAPASLISSPEPPPPRNI